MFAKAKVSEDESDILKKIENGETLQFLSGPQFDDESGVWGKFRSDKDGSAGYVLIHDAKNSRFLNSGGGGGGNKWQGGQEWKVVHAGPGKGGVKGGKGYGKH